MDDTVREGEVVEGLFSLALFQYILKGKAEVKDINAKRRDIDDPSDYSTKYIKSSRTDLKGDTFYVKIQMKLPYATTKHAFGAHKSLNDKNSISLDKKTDQIVKYFSGSQVYSFRSKLDKTIKEFISNNREDIVYFDVLCVGTSNASLRGDDGGTLTKADVEVIIKAFTEKKRTAKPIFKESIKISIKSASTTVENVGVSKSFDRFFKPFSLKATQAARYIPRYNIPKDLTDTQKTILVKYYWFADELDKQQKTSKFTDNAYDLFESMIFGKDLDDLVDIRVGSIKEITREKFKELRKLNLHVDIKSVNLQTGGGGTIIRFISSEDKEIFKLRLNKSLNLIYCDIGTSING